MTPERVEQFRMTLRQLAQRMGSDAAALAEQTLLASGGQTAAGDLSNAPLHLGDMGTEEYLHGLNATLLSHEEHMAGEVRDALHRLDQGTFGRCEGCGEMIPEERLEALPSARYCTRCAATCESESRVNFNRGRPQQPADTLAASAETETTPGLQDIHASGTAGGGTAFGGLAGTNSGNGEPNESELQEAAGSGSAEALEGRDSTAAKGGAAGGAVGGTPANKRAK